VAKQNGAVSDTDAQDAGASAPDGAAFDRPEREPAEAVLLGAAVLGGLLLAGVVSRFGR